MENVFLVPFPKPTIQGKCEECVGLCGRKYFTVDNITKTTYMCVLAISSDHSYSQPEKKKKNRRMSELEFHSV